MGEVAVPIFPPEWNLAVENQPLSSILVPGRGLEPPCLAAHPPQGCLYTNFNTRAGVYQMLPPDLTYSAATSSVWEGVPSTSVSPFWTLRWSTVRLRRIARLTSWAALRRMK